MNDKDSYREEEADKLMEGLFEKEQLPHSFYSASSTERHFLSTVLALLDVLQRKGELTPSPQSPPRSSVPEDIKQEIKALLQQRVILFAENVNNIISTPSTSRRTASTDVFHLQCESALFQKKVGQYLDNHAQENVEDLRVSFLPDGNTVSHYLTNAQMMEILENGYERELFYKSAEILSLLDPHPPTSNPPLSSMSEETTFEPDEPMPPPNAVSSSREGIAQDIAALFQHKFRLFAERLNKLVPSQSTSSRSESTHLTQIQRDLVLLKEKGADYIGKQVAKTLGEMNDTILSNGKKIAEYPMYDYMEEICLHNYQRELLCAAHEMFSIVREEVEQKKGTRPSIPRGQYSFS